MRLENRFDLSAPPERVWLVMNDVEAISPHIPGFSLKEADGDVFRGAMTVKLGAVTIKYKTEITIAERDDAARTVRMKVVGREERGSGRMQAAVTSRLEPAANGTAVSLETDLELAGKAAQMGRGMIADVSASLIREFAGSLEASVLAAPSQDARSHGYDAPADLTGAAGRAAAKRIVPAALVVLIALWLLLVIGGRRWR